MTDALSHVAARHAHALVVEVPGSWRTRVAVERDVSARGWRLADSPADADVLVVCGRPGAGLAEAVEGLWNQMPGPRVRADVLTGDEVGDRLDEARAGLLDTERHRADARQRPGAGDLLEEDEEGSASHGGHEQMDHDAHEQMDHGDMEMSPGGIPLAEGGEDRDGLEMDVLNVRLGPVLPHWPAGLVLRCSLQGDVIVEARAELVDGGAPGEDQGPRPARCMDNLASLLALAGWEDAADEARRIRDLAGEAGQGAAGSGLARLRRRVRRAVLLRWSLRGLRRLSEEETRSLGLPADAVGDTYDRLLAMLDRAADIETPQDRPAHSADHVARLVTGLDLATARLVVASLDIHELRVGEAEHQVSHG